MSDNKYVILKTILDKTGLNKGFKEIQKWLKKSPLRPPVKVDLSGVEKDMQTEINKLNKKAAQAQKQVQKQAQKQAQSSASQKSRDSKAASKASDISKTSAVTGSPPESLASKKSGGLMRLVPLSADLLS